MLSIFMIFQRLNELNQVIENCEYSKKTDQQNFKNKISAYLKQVLLEPEQGFLFFAKILKETVEKKGKIFVIGNGGSAGIASHFATDLLKGIEIPAMTLFDSNIMTCLSNDYGYEHVFSVPLKRLLRKEDSLVAISSSGNSKNIVNAAQVAVDHKISLITLSGFKKDNLLRKMGNLNIWINQEDYGLVETGHFFILHTIIDLWKVGYFSKNNKEQLAYAKQD